MRNGVNASKVYLPKNAVWNTTLQFLLHRFQYVKADDILLRLKRQEIVDENGSAINANTPYKPDSWLWYYRYVPNEAALPFSMSLLYKDENIAVVDKPHFMATIPGGQFLHETALVRLRQQLNSSDVSPIHRLDRDTAGLLLFCLNNKHRGAYQTLFQHQKVKKTYLAIAAYESKYLKKIGYASHICKGEGFLMTESNKPINSYTEIEIIKNLGNGLALYELNPVSGKKHQLRVHLSSLGIPIVNDRLYPELKSQRANDDFSDPLQLLAYGLKFTDPISGLVHKFKSNQKLAYQN